MNRYLLMKTFGEEKDVCLGLHIVLATTDTCIIKSTCYLELDSFFFFHELETKSPRYKRNLTLMETKIELQPPELDEILSSRILMGALGHSTSLAIELHNILEAQAMNRPIKPMS